MLSVSKMATELFVTHGGKTLLRSRIRRLGKAVWTTTIAWKSLSGSTGAMESQPSSIQVSKNVPKKKMNKSYQRRNPICWRSRRGRIAGCLVHITLNNANKILCTPGVLQRTDSWPFSVLRILNKRFGSWFLCNMINGGWGVEPNSTSVRCGSML